MDVSTIYNLSRKLTWSDSIQMPDNTLELFLNIVYHDIEKEITSRVNEDFFYNEWTTNTISWQREYVLPVKSWTTAWLKKLLSVSLKLNSSADYTQLKEERITNYNYDINKFSNLQQFYYIADNSIFIYPVPTENITEWVKLYWISSLWDIQTWWNETTIKIPIEYHDLIVLWMKQYIFDAKNMINEKNDALAQYKNAKELMVATLSDRNLWPMISELPDLSFYK